MGRVEKTDAEKGAVTWKKRLKALGFAGFMFFLIKGLIWLAIMFGGAKFLSGF